MNIYISGINGTGMGPLALMAVDAGLNVQGSDREEGAISPELKAKGIEVEVGAQDGSKLEKLLKDGEVDWFVHTSALPDDHPELVKAREYGVRISKRDELIAFLLEKLGLKMVAVAGTHGKTTTTAMIVWACQKLGVPVSYLVGTTLPFSASGSYQTDAKFFIYEADEYDRNFLHFHPWLAVITSASYDHPDIYPTEQDYQEAFRQFAEQSERVITEVRLEGMGGATGESLGGATGESLGRKKLVEGEVRDILPLLTLAGSVRRYDAALATLAVKQMAPDLSVEEIARVLNDFPGVGRRFERITEGVYSDYAHHPEEIRATVEVAEEEAGRLGLKGVVVVYQPHQNTRQHSVRDDYRTAFTGVDKLYWLPTYLTREDPNLPVLTPQELLEGLEKPEVGEVAELNERLAESLLETQRDGYLVILMTAGPADEWFRKVFANH